MHAACCMGCGRAHSAWHARVCSLKALYDCGVPRTDVCPQSHGRQKGQCNKPCQHRHVRPSRRRAEVRRRTASQRHGPWRGPMGHGPWLINLGRLGKGQTVGKKGCGKLRTTNTRRRAHVCVVLCCCVMCLCVCCTSVCLPLFVCSFVRLFVCLFALSCVCLFLARECACSPVHLSWAEQ